jgi:hypothetical protein
MHRALIFYPFVALAFCACGTDPTQQSDAGPGQGVVAEDDPDLLYVEVEMDELIQINGYNDDIHPAASNVYYPLYPENTVPPEVGFALNAAIRARIQEAGRSMDDIESARFVAFEMVEQYERSITTLFEDITLYVSAEGAAPVEIAYVEDEALLGDGVTTLSLAMTEYEIAPAITTPGGLRFVTEAIFKDFGTNSLVLSYRLKVRIGLREPP